MALLPTNVNDSVPLAMPRENDALSQRFLSVPQHEFDRLSAEIETTLRSLQLPHATGVDLDVIGHNKGPLGIRRGRGDAAYRQYLKALPNAFGGEHRRRDVRHAIASGIVADEQSDVVLDEDVTTNSYTVTLRSWQGHSTALIDFLADYADAPVVKRDDPITYDWGASPDLETSHGAGVVTDIDVGTTGPMNGDTGGASVVVEYEDGFGGFDFDEGWRFDIEEPGEIEELGGYGADYGSDYGN